MPARNAGRAFALVVVDELVRHGVHHAVLAPGSRSTPVALALAEHPAVRLHVRIDERSAAYLALGIAKVTGGVVPVLCTSGTATSYLHGAVMEADLSRIPLLVLTADRPPELRGIGANQTVDQVGLYGAAVRWSCDVGVPEPRPDSVPYWRSVVSRAVAAGLGSDGPPGPVHLNLPLREPLTAVDDGVGFPYELDGRAGDRPWTTTATTPASVPEALRQRVATTRRGVLVVGDGTTFTQAQDLLGFAEHAGWPVVAEPHSMARQRLPALRAVDPVLRDPAFVQAHLPDLVLVVGRLGVSRAVQEWLAAVPHVVVDAYGSFWNPTRRAEAIYRCDAAALAALEPPPPGPGWLVDWTEAADAAGQAIDAVLDASPVLTEPQVARDVAAWVPDDAALVVASSMPIRDLDLVMHPRPIPVVANRGVSGIDGFVSTAQGVALADGGPTFALCGDLSLLHDMTGLLPGPDPRPDVTYVVVNNDGGGIFSLVPQSASGSPDFERLFGTPHGLSLQRVAEALDVHHTVAVTPDELRAALVSGGVRVVEVRTDRAANAELHERLRTTCERQAAL